MALTAAIVQIAQAGVQRGRNPGATPAQPQKFLTVGERHEEPHGYWCWRDESNVRPTDYESVALPTELRQPERDTGRDSDNGASPRDFEGEL